MILYAKQPIGNHRGPTLNEKSHWTKGYLKHIIARLIVSSIPLKVEGTKINTLISLTISTYPKNVYHPTRDVQMDLMPLTWYFYTATNFWGKIITFLDWQLYSTTTSCRLLKKIQNIKKIDIVRCKIYLSKYYYYYYYYYFPRSWLLLAFNCSWVTTTVNFEPSNT